MNPLNWKLLSANLINLIVDSFLTLLTYIFYVYFRILEIFTAYQEYNSTILSFLLVSQRLWESDLENIFFNRIKKLEHTFNVILFREIQVGSSRIHAKVPIYRMFLLFSFLPKSSASALMHWFRYFRHIVIILYLCLFVITLLLWTFHCLRWFRERKLLVSF